MEIHNKNSQQSIEQILRETTEENQSKTDWTKAWSTKYPILKVPVLLQAALHVTYVRWLESRTFVQSHLVQTISRTLFLLQSKVSAS